MILAIELRFEPTQKAWWSLSHIGLSKPELFLYIVKILLQARALEPQPNLVPPLLRASELVQNKLVQNKLVQNKLGQIGGAQQFQV